jgi:hypothetical protein
VVGSRLGAIVGAAGVSDGDADGPKLGMPVGTVLGLSDGCACDDNCMVGTSEVMVGTSDAIAGLPVVGESVKGLLVLGESVVGLRLEGAAVKGEPDDGPPVDGEVLLGAPVHAPTLHAVDSDVVGQACATPTAPAEAATRVREYEPPPHVTEQLLQPVQSPTPQSVHAIAEHAVLLDRTGQAKPPPDATSLTERQR